MRNKEELRLTFHPPMPILPLSKFGTSRVERSIPVYPVHGP